MTSYQPPRHAAKGGTGGDTVCLVEEVKCKEKIVVSLLSIPYQDYGQDLVLKTSHVVRPFCITREGIVNSSARPAPKSNGVSV
jgi:hypothetical protein